MSLSFFLSPPSTDSKQKLAYNLLKILFAPEEIAGLSFADILNRQFLIAVFWRKDAGLLEALRTYYLEGLKNLVLSLDQSQEFDVKRSKEYLWHCLCWLPYFEFPQAKVLSLPYFDEIKKIFVFQNYQVSKIPLNKQRFWMSQSDLCYAYGLTACHSSDKYLIFSGTTYLSGEGFWTHVHNDISLGRDVGYFLYQEGRAEIESFVGEARDCQVLGTSLGGAMALQLALDKPHLKSVYALNPPGKISRMSSLLPTASTTVVFQANDFVSKFGFWHPNWSIVHYDFDDRREGPHPIFDHICNYIGMSKVKREMLNPEDLNQARYWETYLVLIGLRGLLAVILVWPICYVIVPVLKKMYEFFENIVQKTAATLQFF